MAQDGSPQDGLKTTMGTIRGALAPTTWSISFRQVRSTRGHAHFSHATCPHMLMHPTCCGMLRVIITLHACMRMLHSERNTTALAGYSKKQDVNTALPLVPRTLKLQRHSISPNMLAEMHPFLSLPIARIGAEYDVNQRGNQSMTATRNGAPLF